MYRFKFIQEDFDENFNTITVQMDRDFYLDNIRYKTENGQKNIPEVELESPTGAVMLFTNPANFIGGIRYYNGKLNLKIVK